VGKGGRGTVSGSRFYMNPEKRVLGSGPTRTGGGGGAIDQEKDRDERLLRKRGQLEN